MSLTVGCAEQADVARGLASSYACANCCPASFADAYLNPGSVSGFPGDQTQFSFFEVKADCFGNPLAPIARNATWSSTDPSVATCDATGMATGQLPGVTYIQGRWRTFLWDLSANQTCTRTVYDALAEALCDILARRVDDVSPARALIGQPVDVTITGSGFGTGTPTVTAGSGITVSNVSLVSGSEVHARFTIASNATPGNHSVSVRTSFGQTTTISGNFFVQTPSSLGVVSVTTISNGATGNGICYSGTDFGIVVATLYQVKDQQGVAINSTMEPVERNTDFRLNGQTAQPDDPDFDDIGPTSYPGTSQFTNGNGQFLDAPVGICGSGSFTSFTFTQTIGIPLGNSLYTVRANAISVSSNSSGHGTITNGGDIQKSR